MFSRDHAIFPELDNTWTPIKLELLRGRRIEDVGFACTYCNRDIDTTNPNNKAIVAFCGHIYHQQCLRDKRRYDPPNDPDFAPDCPFCEVLDWHEDCHCYAPYFTIPRTWEEALQFHDTALEGGTMAKRCREYSIEEALIRVTRKAWEVMKPLPTQQIVATTGRLTVLSSADQWCTGKSIGIWFEARELGEVWDPVRVVRDSERAELGRIMAEEWGDWKRSDEAPLIAMGIVDRKSGGRCWNCREVGCKNGSQGGSARRARASPDEVFVTL